MKKMNEENKISYYSVLPANVRYDKDLPDKAKLLYSEITSLSNERGYCFATNKYFANLYNCSKRTIQTELVKLQEKGYINIVITENYQRRIYITSPRENEKFFIGRYEKNLIRGDEENFTNNIINNNMIDKLFIYIINEGEKAPKEFENVDKTKIIELLYKYEMLYTKEMLQYISGKNLQIIKDITYVLALIVKDDLEQSVYRISRDKLIQLYNECKSREIQYNGTRNEIAGFINYYYKSIKNEMVRDYDQSFFMQQKRENGNFINKKDEEIEI